MYFALCRCEIFIPDARSLKAKRSVLNRVKERLRSRYRVAIAEVGTQDLWQRGTLGIALVGIRPQALEDGLAAMRRLIEQETRCQLTLWETRVEPFGDQPLQSPPLPNAAGGDPPWDAPEEGDELFGAIWEKQPGGEEDAGGRGDVGSDVDGAAPDGEPPRGE